MAAATPKSLRNQVMYSIFVRNYSKEGTFEAVQKDLDRIKALGVDIIWLMPIHPVGKVHRKGTLGSPYAIADYRAVNPEFGTKEDFQRLVEDIHKHGMKCIIDVVYNHTSPDSWLAQNHPEWFYHKADGSLGNKTGDWWDVVDLDYSHRELWYYQIETLCQWARIVDGFRCDVASMVPIEFWKEARKAVETVHPGMLWLAESVEPAFVRANRHRGITCSSDGQIFEAFDMSYEYDVYDYFNGYLSGRNTLADYARALNQQEEIYPDNYDKLRFLENHDRLRAHFVIPDETPLRAWTAFLYFQKGTTLLYAGQEKGVRHTPSLFDKDPIDWKGAERENNRLSGDGGAVTDLTPLLQQLAGIKKDDVFTDSTYEVKALADDVLMAVHTKNGRPQTAQEERAAGGEAAVHAGADEKAAGRHTRALGLFSLRGRSCLVNVAEVIPDGSYKDAISNGTIEVNMGQTWIGSAPVIILY